MRSIIGLFVCLMLSVPVWAGDLPPLLADLGLRESTQASRDMPGWKKPERIVVRTVFGPRIAQQLQQSLPGIEVIGAASAAEAKAAMPGAQVLIGFCEESIFEAADSLTDDLVWALENASIAGAALDVTDPEPLPANHPLWSTSGAFITPNIAARSPETMQRIMALVMENLKRYVAGAPLLSVVNIKKGY